MTASVIVFLSKFRMSLLRTEDPSAGLWRIADQRPLQQWMKRGRIDRRAGSSTAMR